MALRTKVSLRSRIPEIVIALPQDVERGLANGAQLIAKTAADRAPVRTGALKDSIEAKPAKDNAVEIVAAWYWFFAEYGTRNEAARPFMIPAAEEGRGVVEQEVRAVLKTL